MNNLLWLGDPKAFDATLVGGKAATLSRLARSNFRVPDGFCIPVNLMKEMHLQRLHDDIASAISRLKACHRLSKLAVAIRSSAVDEDSADASFAGQHETYLNIVGLDAIVQAVVRCWESARSKRALAYRRQHRLAAEEPQIAVLVQQLVQAEASAVVFSANPVTGNRDEILINANWGLGESIVNGTVTPDTFAICKSDLTATKRIIAIKQQMTIPAAVGTKEVNTPRFLRTKPSLSDEQLQELIRLALTLEKSMAHPVDIECAYTAGTLYLLQCRPITTLP